jgi:hypothetical protein
MREGNFGMLIKMSNKFLTIPEYEQYHKILSNLYHLGLSIQELENELWDGYPYIYANLRVLIEEVMNFFIENEFEITVLEGSGDEFMKSDEIRNWILNIKNGKLNSWRKSSIKVEKSTFNLNHKINLVNAGLSIKGVNISEWELHEWRKNLNDTSHNFFLPVGKAESGFKNRFELLKRFHNQVYRGLVKLYFKRDPGTYLGPTEEELKIIAKKFDDRINSYK